MGSRGRKSGASLSVVTPFPQRPKPPRELTKEQAQIWRDTVGRLPPDWFGREMFPLLVAFCRHVTSARFVSRQLNAIGSADLGDPKIFRRYGAFLRMEALESAAIARMATKLRLTNQSRYTPAGAAAAARRSGPVLWE
jgi:hypothetical protein